MAPSWKCTRSITSTARRRAFWKEVLTSWWGPPSLRVKVRRPAHLMPGEMAKAAPLEINFSIS